MTEPITFDLPTSTCVEEKPSTPEAPRTELTQTEGKELAWTESNESTSIQDDFKELTQAEVMEMVNRPIEDDLLQCKNKIFKAPIGVENLTSSSLHTIMNLRRPRLFAKLDDAKSSLSIEELKEAYRELYNRLCDVPSMRETFNKTKYERRELFNADPAISGQVYALFSWQAHPTAVPHEGCFGTFKVRYVCSDIREAEQKALELVNTVDACNVIRPVLVGETYPLIDPKNKMYSDRTINATCSVAKPYRD
jgi:hypothetical protein